MTRALPSGLVTFAFVDVVGSTKVLAAHGDAYAESLGRLLAEVAEHAGRHGGLVVKTDGDGAFLAFPSAAGGVAALCELQTTLDDPRVFGTGPPLRIRAGAHCGEAWPSADDYVSLSVNVAARLRRPRERVRYWSPMP